VDESTLKSNTGYKIFRVCLFSVGKNGSLTSNDLELATVLDIFYFAPSFNRVGMSIRLPSARNPLLNFIEKQLFTKR